MGSQTSELATTIKDEMSLISVKIELALSQNTHVSNAPQNKKTGEPWGFVLSYERLQL